MKILFLIIYFLFSIPAHSSDWSTIIDTPKIKVWKNSKFPKTYLTEASFFSSKVEHKKMMLELFNIRFWKITSEQNKFIQGNYVDRSNVRNYFFESKEKKSIHISTTDFQNKNKLKKIYDDFKRYGKTK